MASKPPKPSARPSRPAAPANPNDADGDSPGGDPRPAAQAAPPAPTAPPPRTAATEAALAQAGISADMIALRDNLQNALTNPQGPAAQAAADPSKLGARNVIGTALGVQYTNGRPNGRRGPVVLVSTKADADAVAQGFMVPKSELVRGERIPVDVVEVRFPTAQLGGFQTQEAWPRYGASIGRSGGQTGTYGMRVRRNRAGEPNRPMCALSNAHVLVYDTHGNAAPVGSQTRAVHPGDADVQFGAQAWVADLYDYIPLQLSPFQYVAWNHVDAAIAWTTPDDLAARFHFDHPFDPTPADPHIGMAVIKEGRTTGYTEGVIHQLDVRVNVNYRERGYPPLYGAFYDQIQITGTFGPFSEPGDSGSAVLGLVNGVYRPVGLLFAGDGPTTWANPIKAVMEALDLDRINFRPEDV